jgi:hypothetical protein
LSLRSDNLDSVGELYTKNDFRQLVVAIEATPTFLGGLGERDARTRRGVPVAYVASFWRSGRAVR